jgi:RHS repeat-associated protein
MGGLSGEHLRVQTTDTAGNWSAWTAPPLFTFQYDGVPPIISDLTPPNSSVITNAWPVISASLSDPAPGSGIQPLSTTLIVDSQVVTPQVSTATGFAYTPTQRLAEGNHSVSAWAYDQAGNQATSAWSFEVVDNSAPSLGVTKYYYHGTQRVAMRRDGVVYFIHTDHLGSSSLTTNQSGAPVAQTRYLPYGEEGWTDGNPQPTDFAFTGQRRDSYIKLMEMGARWYDPQIGRWISPDILSTVTKSHFRRSET